MRKTLIASFIVIGVLIGLLITAHFKTQAPVSSLFPADLIEARKDLIKDYVDEQSLLQAKITTSHKDIEIIQKQNEEFISKGKLIDLENLKKKIGVTEIEGSGIDITLNDSPNITRETLLPSDKSLIHPSDLRDIINLLWANRAEAIMVNNQRIIATTPISSAGSSILVNNVYIVPPITISAIINPDLFWSRMQEKSVLTDLKIRIAKKEIQFAVISRQLISVPIYTGDFKLKYITAANDE